MQQIWTPQAEVGARRGTVPDGVYVCACAQVQCHARQGTTGTGPDMELRHGNPAALFEDIG